MKYLVLLTMVSFVSVCVLVASSDLDQLKQDLRIADWTDRGDSEDADSLSPAAAMGDDAASWQGGDLVLMKFGATWCPPCRMVDQELKTLAKSDLPVKIRKIDIDKRPDLARKHNISSIPRLILLEGGREIGDLTGYRSADQLNDWINSNASSQALAGEKRSAAPSVVVANPFVQ